MVLKITCPRISSICARTSSDQRTLSEKSTYFLINSKEQLNHINKTDMYTYFVLSFIDIVTLINQTR